MISQVPGSGQLTLDHLSQAPETDQRARGYFHTLREILQQPDTWIETADVSTRSRPELERVLEGVRAIVLTGSGSSQFAGECMEDELRRQLRIPVRTIAAGDLLMFGSVALPPLRPLLLLSIARSGDSPESVETVARLLETEPEVRHVAITCNAQGGLATHFRKDSRVLVIILPERTCDKSLAMTSSFTNLVLVGQMLGSPRDQAATCRRLSGLGRAVIGMSAIIANVASPDFSRAVFLASGSRLGAAKESALKMLEMTAGHVATLPSTYLGLRHGPMSFLNEKTLVACFLSSNPVIRQYETDLIRELLRKQLGMAILILGGAIPENLAGANIVKLECPGMQDERDSMLPVLDVIVGQLLGLLCSLKLGLRPDAPSDKGVINRVVEPFTLYGSMGRN